MAKDLVLYFKDQENKKVSLRVKDVKEELTSEQVEKLMDTIIEKNIFKFPSGDIVDKDRAEVVSKDIEEFKF